MFFVSACGDVDPVVFMLRTDPKVVATLDAFRRMRNFADYEQAGTVPESSAIEAAGLAKILRASLIAWSKAQHPELL